MSSPKYAWYGEVKRRIIEGKWSNPESFQDWIYLNAIAMAILETLALPDGKLRMKAVNEILFQHIRNYDGVAAEVYRDRSTIQMWVTSFVNLVGRKAGN